MAGFLLTLRKCAPCGNVQTGKTGCRYEGEKKYGLICMEGEMCILQSQDNLPRRYGS